MIQTWKSPLTAATVQRAKGKTRTFLSLPTTAELVKDHAFDAAVLVAALAFIVFAACC